MPRLRQAVLAARDLEPAVDHLRETFRLGEPYRDPAVAYFGLRNAVFAIGDTFLEIISPVSPDVPGARTAVRQLERSERPVCGYMCMVQVDDLAASRERARTAGVREVFEVEFDDIAEVHLHPGDMRGAIVSLSEPQPAASWRWGGEGWPGRSVEGEVSGITVAVDEPDRVNARWESIAGGPIPGCRFVHHPRSPGIVEIDVRIGGTPHAIRPAAIDG